MRKDILAVKTITIKRRFKLVLMREVAYPTSVHLSIPELHDHLVALQLPLVGCQQVLQGSQLRLQPLNLLCCCIFPPEGAHQGLLSILQHGRCHCLISCKLICWQLFDQRQTRGFTKDCLCMHTSPPRQEWTCYKLVTIVCNTAWRSSPRQPLLANHATKACDKPSAVSKFCALWSLQTQVLLYKTQNKEDCWNRWTED